VKLILRMLKSATFQGAAPLLAAIASTDADTHAPVGLLKVRSWGWLQDIRAMLLPLMQKACLKTTVADNLPYALYGRDLLAGAHAAA
jgi:hypothetical protein